MMFELAKMSATENKKYDLWLGSDLGLLKGVVLSKDSFINYGDIKTLDKAQSISCMSWQKFDKQNSLLVGLQNGVVKTFDCSTCCYTSTLNSHKSPIRGIIGMTDGSIVSCVESGKLQHWKDGANIFEKDLGPDIKCMVPSNTPEIFATGGIENDVKVYQLENMEKPLFVAKNVRNDFLNLRSPIWISAIEFFKKDSNKLAVASGHHTVRIYDQRDKRRPVMTTDWHEHPITAIALKPNNASLIVGNSAGYMGELDLRSNKQVGAFKGNAGSIRSIIYHPSQPLIAACGLDRFLKIYDANSRKLIKKIYTKSALNCMVMSSSQIQVSSAVLGEKREAEDELDDEEEEKIWSSMEPVKSTKDTVTKVTGSKKKKAKKK
ncbi:WD repeat-containing protein 74 isoform X4 [Hydra vulgaris]|uniref:WD repeat-containing protein 74 isoform X4 n=2 Tax=Hydra vulgaris TaxID=6087 RepID=A0ABM4D142_HYDVU